MCPAVAERQDAALEEQIEQIYQSSRRTYGSPRVQAELRAEATKVFAETERTVDAATGLIGPPQTAPHLHD